jgi:hypothetical protein
MVLTDASTNKHATSHDIRRRAFTSRLGRRLSTAELSKWMRHTSSDTTLRYYHAPTTEELAGRVWGDTLGDRAQKQGSTPAQGVMPNSRFSKILESGGHETRTRNSLRSTSFPMRPLAIRLPSELFGPVHYVVRVFSFNCDSPLRRSSED